MPFESAEFVRVTNDQVTHRRTLRKNGCNRGSIASDQLGGLVIFSDNVKRCRPKWFGLVWGYQEKERRIRSKKGGKVARARRREWSFRDDRAKECLPRDDGVAHERNDWAADR